MKKMDMYCFGMWHLVEEDNGDRYLAIRTYTNDGKHQEMRVEVNEQEIRFLQTVIEQSGWGKKESDHVSELEKIAKFGLECMDRMSEQNEKLYDANKKLKEEIEENRKWICNLIQATGKILGAKMKS